MQRLLRVRTFVVLFAVTVTGVASASVLGNNRAKNGSFERPALLCCFNGFNAGSSIGPWAVVAESVDLVAAPWEHAHKDQSLDLNGNDSGTIEQQVATAAETTYVLTFFLAGNTGCGPGVKTVRVWWDGAVVATLNFDTTGHSHKDMGWELHAFRVTASHSQTPLRFQALSRGPCGPTLDGVSVKPA